MNSRNREITVKLEIRYVPLKPENREAWFNSFRILNRLAQEAMQREKEEQERLAENPLSQNTRSG